MKAPSSHPYSRLLLVGIALALGTLHVQAAGTAAGVSIDNQATIGYTVGGVSQTAVNSNTLSFVVDRKIDLTVATTDVAPVSITPGTDSVLAFTLENTGNDVQDFAFAVTAKANGAGAGAFGGDDVGNIDSTAVRVESGATVGYQSGEDTATFVDELAADGTATIYIVGTYTTGLANGAIASYHLTATARAGGSAGGGVGAALTETAGADTAGSVDIVFADGIGSETVGDTARDAEFSADSDFTVATAALTVTKSSAVISDPFNAGTNPKAIPGAVIEYTITVANGGGAQTATGLSVTDSLDTEITAGTIAFNVNGYAAGSGIQITAPNINGGAAQNTTNADDSDEGDWNVTAANTVTVTGIQLAGGESATVKFRVTIQ